MLRRVLIVPVAIVVFGLLSGVAAAAGGECPNEALRTELGSGSLPDCRAYEMVTPPFKEGYGLAFDDAVSSVGDKSFLISFATLAGDPGGGEIGNAGGAYINTRTGAGWRISPINPSPTEYVGRLYATEADSGVSLWVQHTPEQSATEQDLYVRSASGVFSLIGPLNPPAVSAGESSNVMESLLEAKPVAATSDYGHIVFEAKDTDRWSFDDTQGNAHSLYEYSGLYNPQHPQPTLVGVTGGKESVKLVGDCGAEIGGGRLGSAYNAISSDGETIFFTPELLGHQGCEGVGVSAPVVPEVYARLHGSPLAPEQAETVDVSEPPLADCKECDTSNPAGAVFEGASEDGSKAFFLSTQEDLLPGAEGMNLYEYNFAPRESDNKLVRVSNGVSGKVAEPKVLGVARVAENGSRVYYVAEGVLTGVQENEYGVVAKENEPNLYVYDAETGTTTFIATLSTEDTSDWNTTDKRPVEATPNGDFLVFSSSQPGLTGAEEDTANTTQLFEYDALTGELVRISKGENGYNDNGNDVTKGVEIAGVEFKEADFKTSSSRYPHAAIADNGLTVVFPTKARLSALAFSAELGCSSVYEYRSAGSLAEGSVHLISDGLDVQNIKGSTCGAQFGGMDAEGNNIFFSTADPLLKSDTDGTQRDLYDARVDGGFALPGEAPGCALEGCHGPLSSPPVLSGAGSVSQSPGENIPPAVSKPTVKAKARVLTRTQRVAKALKACHAKKQRRQRAACEAQARKRYAPKAGKSDSNHRRGK